MNVATCISVEATAQATELAGAQDGAVWANAMRTVVDGAVPGLHAIDFTGIRLATVSWLREAVLGLIGYATTVRPDLYFIAANASPKVAEELGVALEARSSVLILADVSESRAVSRPRVVGKLDAALDEALRLVVGEPECDASFLTAAVPRLGLSAANNRLAALETRRVLTSVRRGRSRIYSPLLKGLTYGH